MGGFIFLAVAVAIAYFVWPDGVTSQTLSQMTFGSLLRVTGFGLIAMQSLRVTPAMAAGITDRLWSLDDIVVLMEAREKAPGKRGPYKKRANQSVISN